MYHTIPFRTPSFAGHESFPLRFAWLKKGFDGLRSNPAFFGLEGAMVELGVGKNMVRAIRHWGLAAQVWDEVDGSRGREVRATELGVRLLEDNVGWDPYLEDIGTIWLLHWLVVTHQDRATTWTWTFGRPSANRFDKDELLSELKALVRDEGISRMPDATLKRDIAVMLRGYCRPRAILGGFGEDTLDSPFTLLNLVRPSGERGAYEIVQGSHPTLPTRVFEAALVDYVGSLREQQAPAITLDELLYAPLSPGRTFRLSEEGLVSRLTALVSSDPDLYAFDETAGLRQLLIRGTVPDRLDVLAGHYETTSLTEAVA